MNPTSLRIDPTYYAIAFDGAYLTMRRMFPLPACLMLACWLTCTLSAPTVQAQSDTAGASPEQSASESQSEETEAGESEEQQVPTPLDEDGNLVRFSRDIAPILVEHCLECHGPDEAKMDFRVDEPESLLAYVEPEDPEWSTLYADYLTTEDQDMLMPPVSHGGPLSASELALIRVWIEEGAEWPEDVALVEGSEDDEAEAAMLPSMPTSLPERVWVAQGYLHPATVHFPIAFFLLGGVFVLLGIKWPRLSSQIPLACLLLGALSAVASSAMGWAFAPEQGYGAGWQFLNWDREIDVHRWSGVIVTAVSVLFALIALVSLKKRSKMLTKAWKIGLLLCAVMVGLVGHQGGEMNYGHDFYPKAWRILTGTPETDEDLPVEVTGEFHSSR